MNFNNSNSNNKNAQSSKNSKKSSSSSNVNQLGPINTNNLNDLNQAQLLATAAAMFPSLFQNANINAAASVPNYQHYLHNQTATSSSAPMTSTSNQTINNSNLDA